MCYLSYSTLQISYPFHKLGFLIQFELIWGDFNELYLVNILRRSKNVRQLMFVHLATELTFTDHLVLVSQKPIKRKPHC